MKMCVCVFFCFHAKLPEEILARLPVPSAEAVRDGIASMVSMVSSPYDDIAVNGCASVAKLAAASDRTRRTMAESRDLVEALLQVIIGRQFGVASCRFSLDTLTNAALALSELTIESAGQANLLAAAESNKGCAKMLAFCNAAEIHADEEHTVKFLRAYWCVLFGYFFHTAFLLFF